MISETNFEKLTKPPFHYKKNILEAIKDLKAGIISYNFFFLKLLQEKLPFLPYVSDDLLASVGSIIIEQLPNIKTYNGLSAIIKAVYGAQVGVVYIETDNPAELKIQVNNVPIEVEKNLSTLGAVDIVTQNGQELAMNGYSDFNTQDYQSFLEQFVLAGVHVIDLEINYEYVYKTIATLNGEDLVTLDGTLIQATGYLDDDNQELNVSFIA